MTQIIEEIIVPDGARSRNKRVIFLTLIVVLTCVIILGTYAFIGGRELTYNSLNFSSVKYGSVADAVGGYGNLAPKSTQALTAMQGGTITYSAIQAGQRVKKGDILARLINLEVNRRLDDAKKNYVTEKSDIFANINSSKKQLIDLRVKRDDLSDEVKTQTIKVGGEKPLAKNGVIPKMTYFEDEMRLKSLQRQLSAASKEFASLETTTDEQNKQDNEKLKFFKDQVEGRRDDLNSLVVRAPGDGIIYKIPDDLVVGRTLPPGGEIATFIEINNLQAIFQVSAADASSIREGMLVTISIGGRQLLGTVNRIDPKIVQDQVKVIADTDEKSLVGMLPGQPLTASIVRKKYPGALYLNAWEEAKPNTDQYVYVVSNDRKQLQRSFITLGKRIGSFILIKKGLKAGDKVVTGGLPPSAAQSSYPLK